MDMGSISNENFTRVQKALEQAGLDAEYFEKFKEHELDDMVMVDLLQDIELSQNIQRIIPILGHEMKFKLQFKKLCPDEFPKPLPFRTNAQAEDEIIEEEEADDDDDSPEYKPYRVQYKRKRGTTQHSIVKPLVKTERKRPRSRARSTPAVSQSSGTVVSSRLNSSDGIKKRGRPRKYLTEPVANMITVASPRNGQLELDNENQVHDEADEEHEFEHGSPGPGLGSSSTSPPLKKRGRPALATKKKHSLNAFENLHNNNTIPDNQSQQQEGSLKFQNSSENAFKKPRGRPKKINTPKLPSGKKQTSSEFLRLKETGMTDLVGYSLPQCYENGIKKEISDEEFHYGTEEDITPLLSPNSPPSGKMFDSNEFHGMPLLDPVMDNFSRDQYDGGEGNKTPQGDEEQQLQAIDTPLKLKLKSNSISILSSAQSEASNSPNSAASPGKLSVAVKSRQGQTLHPRKQCFILKSDSEIRSENSID